MHDIVSGGQARVAGVIVALQSARIGVRTRDRGPAAEASNVAGGREVPERPLHVLRAAADSVRDGRTVATRGIGNDAEEVAVHEAQ